MVKERNSIKMEYAQKITKKKCRINLCKLGRQLRKEDTVIGVQGCRTSDRKGYRSFRNSKAAQQRGKDIYIFTIYKTTNQIR